MYIYMYIRALKMFSVNMQQDYNVVPMAIDIHMYGTNHPQLKQSTRVTRVE